MRKKFKKDFFQTVLLATAADEVQDSSWEALESQRGAGRDEQKLQPLLNLVLEPRTCERGKANGMPVTAVRPHKQPQEDAEATTEQAAGRAGDWQGHGGSREGCGGQRAAQKKGSVSLEGDDALHKDGGEQFRLFRSRRALC